jgi:hypothetical protein
MSTSPLAIWFAREGWLWATAGLTVAIGIFAALAYLLPMPGDDDEWGGGSF